MCTRSAKRLIVTLLLASFVQFSISDPLIGRFFRRQNSNSLTINDQLSLNTDGSTVTPSFVTGSNGQNGETSTTLDMSSILPSTSISSSISATTSALDGIYTPQINPSEYSHGINPNDLPIIPRITPGFAVTGVILVICGIMYGMIGIKIQWLQSFLSSAYIAGIATLVLILYVMNPPIADTTQGAYVFAVILASATIGTASVLFTEIAQGTSCLLGGFCLSMWLLVLKPDGLLTGFSRLILITILTIGACAILFNKYIKSYSIIILTSFGGATSTVMGIDCFSRAGLKEFWVYIWALNPEIFPNGIISYPLTRGMKVEIASILVISLVGIISQMKFWKTIREIQKNETDDSLRIARRMEEEEENIGRDVVEKTIEARNRWEAVYGENDKDLHISTVSEDSEVTSPIGKKARPISAENDILPTSNNTKNKKAINVPAVIVDVAQDVDEPQDQESQTQSKKNLDKENALLSSGTDDEVSSQIRTLKSIDQIKEDLPKTDVTLAPVFTPLPFDVSGNNNISADDISSVGTCATLGDEILFGQPDSPQSMRSNLSLKSSRMSNTSLIPGNFSTNNDTGIEDDTESLATISAGAKNNSSTHISYESVTPITEFSPESQLDALKETEAMKNPSNKDETIENPLTLAPSVSISDIESESKSELLSTKNLPKESNESPKSTSLSVSSKNSKNSKSSKNPKINKDTLPTQLSKVFLTYRTNEWAKHLDDAEKPEMEALKLDQESDKLEYETSEKPVPVMIQELQQTPENPYPSSNPYYNSKQANNQLGMNISRLSLSEDRNTNGYLRREKSDIHPPQDSALIHDMSQQSLSSFQRGKYYSTAPSTYNSKPIDSTSVSLDSSRGIHVPPQAQQSNKRGWNATTLIGQRDSMIKSKTLFYNRLSGLSTPELGTVSLSRSGSSETASVYNNPILFGDEGNMSLSQRRELIRQSSLVLPKIQNSISGPTTFLTKLNSQQARHISTLPSTHARQQQLANWRASVHQDLNASVLPHDRIEQQLGMLREIQKQKDMRRLDEERRRDAEEGARDEVMRSGEMQSAHREALRRLQQKANQKIT